MALKPKKKTRKPIPPAPRAPHGRPMRPAPVPAAARAPEAKPKETIFNKPLAGRPRNAPAPADVAREFEKVDGWIYVLKKPMQLSDGSWAKKLFIPKSGYENSMREIDRQYAEDQKKR